MTCQIPSQKKRKKEKKKKKDISNSNTMEMVPFDVMSLGGLEW